MTHRLGPPALVLLLLCGGCTAPNPDLLQGGCPAQRSPLAVGTQDECRDRTFNVPAWLSSHDARPAAARTLQAGQREPAPFAGQDWAREIDGFRAAWDELMGPVPASDVPLDSCETALDLPAAQRSAVEAAPYTLSRVAYRGAHGAYIPALLLVPRQLLGRRPAVIVAHQALADCGKYEPAGVCPQGSQSLAFARLLAERGLVALAPDTIGFGERAFCSTWTDTEYSDAAPLLSRFPAATLMGLRISDMSRAADYLQTLPFVDPGRLGMIGHSNGGIESLFTAAFEPRIRCTVSNAGPNLIRRETSSTLGLPPGIDRWASFGYLPSLALYSADVGALPIEMHQLYAMIAPRGLFLSMMEDDSIAPTYDRIDFAVEQAGRAFQARGGRLEGVTIRSGLTEDCREQIGVGLCLAGRYKECVQSGDAGCLQGFAAAGLTDKCIAENDDDPEDCAIALYWQQCRTKEGQSAQACQERFAPLGVDAACIARAFQLGCRRDHGWYPETQEQALPWLEQCLSD